MVKAERYLASESRKTSRVLARVSTALGSSLRFRTLLKTIKYFFCGPG